MVNYICQRCKTSFYKKYNYNKHINKKIPCSFREKPDISVKEFKCFDCGNSFCRPDILKNHKCSKTQINNNSNVENGIVNQVVGNNNITINNYFNMPNPILISQPHNQNTIDEKIAILSSKENPLFMIVIFTHLNPNKPQYHNIGYDDDHSSIGYIWNGKKFVKSPIYQILRDVVENRLKDLEQIHIDLKDCISDKANQIIKDKLDSIYELLWGSQNPKKPIHGDKNQKQLKKIYHSLKNLMYKSRDVFKKAYERTNKLNNSNDTDDIPKLDDNMMKNFFKPGITKKDIERCQLNNFNINKQKDLALYLLNLSNQFNNIDNNNYHTIYKRIQDTSDINILSSIISALNNFITTPVITNNNIDLQISLDNEIRNFFNRT